MIINSDNGAFPAVDLNRVPVLEGSGGVYGAHNTGQSVFARHNRAVGDETAQLSHNAAQEREVRTPTNVGAHSDEDVALETEQLRVCLLLVRS